MSINQKTRQYRVSITGLTLPPEVEKKIECEIRRVVLEQLAAIDLKCDLLISALGRTASLGGGGPTTGLFAKAQ